MVTAKQILKDSFKGVHPSQYEDLSNAQHTAINKAMVTYANLQCDVIHDLFNKPCIELEPLEDLWRKENPREKFTIPDMTDFYRWIRKKILSE